LSLISSCTVPTARRKLTGVFDLLKIMLYKVCANGSSALPDWEMEASIMEFYAVASSKWHHRAGRQETEKIVPEKI